MAIPTAESNRVGRVALALLGSIMIAPATAAPSHISIADLRATAYTGGLISNRAFTPSEDAGAAHEGFVGSLHLLEAEMQTLPSELKSKRVLGKATTVFPGVDLYFFTVDGDLVPTTQDVIRSGSINRGRSFWDLIVQPGRVWSEPGDGTWSRASFPFALVNSLEGETHNGVATFAYRGGQVSNLRFQVVQQTSPYLVMDHFTASGTASASWRRAAIPHLELLTEEYRQSLADEVPIGSWAELAAQAESGSLAGFDESLPSHDGVLAGLDYHGRFYLKYCSSAAGELPWCDRARFGVWSATKALANETALLRLAQKFGPEVFDLKIADYVREAASYPAWRDVRFEDAINMATGIGNGSTKRDPNNISDGYLDPTYDAWYEAPSESAKIAALLTDGRAYPWGPGKVARYRDQDMFVLGVAMDRYLKSREGPGSSLWSMLEIEVYRPIGIHYAPTNRTIESNARHEQPLMAYGYYPTIGDMVKIARLYQNEGRNAGTQLLYSPRIHALLRASDSVGLPTGAKTQFGETRYYNAFWMTSYQAGDKCRLLYPVMEGWGGDLVALLPRGATAIRLAKAAETNDDQSSDPTDMAIVANRLDAFCP